MHVAVGVITCVTCVEILKNCCKACKTLDASQIDRATDNFLRWHHFLICVGGGETINFAMCNEC